MEKTFHKGEFDGYEIKAAGVSIHSHINDPERWHVTCREIGIFGKAICSKKVSNTQLLNYVYDLLTNEINSRQKIREFIASEIDEETNN